MRDGERLYPKNWSGSTPLGGFARDVAAWLGYVDPKHEAGKLIQRITKGALRATEALTVTEGAARATVLKVTQAEPSHGFVAWQALVDGYAPKSSNDPATALQPIRVTPKRCKDARELKERLTAWSLKVAEHEHQFKVIDEVQKILVVRAMMPKDPRKFDEIMKNWRSSSLR